MQIETVEYESRVTEYKSQIAGYENNLLNAELIHWIYTSYSLNKWKSFAGMKIIHWSIKKSFTEICHKWATIVAVAYL